MTDLEVRAALNDRKAFALTLGGEARGEPDAGRRAVASVIRNRLLSGRWGESYRSVCLWPAQFSCWAPVGGPANYAVVMACARAMLDETPTVLPGWLRSCAAIADLAMAGQLEDATRGALYYLTETLYATHPPAWSLKVVRTAQVGAHVFFK